MTGQRLLGLRLRRPTLAWRRRARLPIHPIHRLDRNIGFSLVELLIVAGLTAVVLAGLGSLTLISDVQVGRRSDSIQEAREQWGRAVTFIQSEVADAATISSVPLSDSDYPSSTSSTCGVKPDPVLVLKGPNNPPAWTVIYGVRDIAETEKNLYRGPKLLVRCGPLPLAAERNPPNPELTSIYGNLDDTKLSPTFSVVLDRLPATNPLKVDLLANPDNGPVQDAQLTITMKAGTEKDGTDITYAGDQPFRVHVQRSPTP